MYHSLPCALTTILRMSMTVDGSFITRICPVLGSKCAILLPLITATKMLPSGAITRSRAKRSVGTGHSLTLPAGLLIVLEVMP